MKLFTRYNRINLMATVIIFLLSGIAFYFLLRLVLVGQVDEDLKIEQHEVETYVAKYDTLPEIIPVHDQDISYEFVGHPEPRRRFTTVILHSDENLKEKEKFRQVIFFVHARSGWYRVSVSKSLEGTQHLAQSIIIITLATILAILAVSFLINRLVLRKIWQPFYDTLSAMRSFTLGKESSPSFPDTSIDEFCVMNETLREAIAKAEQEYHYLKEFTENASHELQTPLAIIQSKMDVLIQDEHLSEAQSRAVQGAYEAIQRLSRLNQALLLLTKIENGQYRERSMIYPGRKIKEKLSQFAEMASSKSLQIETSLDDQAVIDINPLLADIILNNLLSNAIKYSNPGDLISISVKQGIIDICNTASHGALEKDQLFRRFALAGRGHEGIGLGLAIVKQAVVISGLSIWYTYRNDMHCFSLSETIRE